MSLDSFTHKDRINGACPANRDANLGGYVEDMVDQINTNETNISTSDAAAIKKDGSVDFTGDQSMGSNKLTNLAAGSASGDAINKSQLDAAIAGRYWRQAVDEIALTPSGNESGNDGWRVLIKGTGADAFAGHDNEIAIWDDTGSAWSFSGAPSQNWTVYNADTDEKYTYDDDTSAWINTSFASRCEVVAGVNGSVTPEELASPVGVGDIQAILAFVSASGNVATPCLLAETTDYELTGNDKVQINSDQSLNNLLILYTHV